MRLLFVFLAAGALLAGPWPCLAGQSQPAGETTATHAEARVIGQAPGPAFNRLSTLCLDRAGNLLAGDSGSGEVKVFSPGGKLLATWKPGVKPYAICACPDGSVYVGGRGKLVKLDAEGEVLKTVSAAEGDFPQARVSGLAATDKDVFASLGSGWSLRSKASIVRFDRDLAGAKTIASGLRGCCQRLDLVTRDGVLYVAENTRYRVVKYGRDGKVLAHWGRRDRKAIDGFGSCCNPMNLCFGPGGVLYTAESGLGRIKRYDADGKFLGLVGFVQVPRFTSAGRVAASCSNIAIAVSKDGRRVYVQDVKKNVVRVLERKRG